MRRDVGWLDDSGRWVSADDVQADIDRDASERRIALAVAEALRGLTGQAPVSDRSPEPEVSTEETPTGAALLKAHFGADELARIDAVRGSEGRGLWLRRVLGGALLRGGPLPEPGRVRGRAECVNFRAPSATVEALDRARGVAARNAYIRAVALAALV